MIEAKSISKYAKYSTPKLRERAAFYFNRWIRVRDYGKPCISCGSWNHSDAGHFYSAGHHPELQFHPDNVHGQCKRCNLFLSGNLNEYRKRLIQRIGSERVEALDQIVAQVRRTGYKHDRINLINIIEKYR